MAEKKSYMFRFDVVESWKAWFEAESDEEAAELFKKLRNGDIETDELPGYGESNKGIDANYDYGLENEAGQYVDIKEDEESND